MRVLVIEDDPNKMEIVCAFLGEARPAHELRVAGSYKSGLKEMTAEWAEVFLLDMSLPTFDMSASEAGGSLLALGGRNLMRQMQLRRINTPVIVITQFETFGPEAPSLQALEHSLRVEFPDIFVGCVYYNAAVLGWQRSITTLLDKVSRHGIA